MCVCARVRTFVCPINNTFVVGVAVNASLCVRVCVCIRRCACMSMLDGVREDVILPCNAGSAYPTDVSKGPGVRDPDVDGVPGSSSTSDSTQHTYRRYKRSLISLGTRARADNIILRHICAAALNA